MTASPVWSKPSSDNRGLCLACTPSDFVVAIMFDKDNTPLPPYRGQTGWIEIWKGSKGYYALKNGRAGKQLNQCTH